MRHRNVILAAALLLLCAVAAVLAVGAFEPGGASTARADDPVVLTVTGNGQTVTFTMTQLKALPEYDGWSGMKNSAGTVTPPAPVKGVKLSDVLAQIGGMTTMESVDVTASDNYGMTFLYGQIMSGADIVMYNATTKAPETLKAPVSLVLTYEYDGQPITPAPGGEGPVRLAVCQPTNVNQVADGHLMVKWVSNVTLRSAVRPWQVKMYGLWRNGKRQTYTLDRNSYDSCATPGCHGSSWVQPVVARTWSGVPLFLCIGKVDGGKGHGGYGAYNVALALKGYRIKLTSATGKRVIIGSRTIINNARILLANKLMGSELTASTYPLRLVGPKIGGKKFLGRITKIQLLPKR
jgi:DMSO/TMAO reductase YedYZ molybdopterin-dependent catalytic subunit